MKTRSFQTQHNYYNSSHTGAQDPWGWGGGAGGFHVRDDPHLGLKSMQVDPTRVLDTRGEFELWREN
jgi:hypothetical protein